MLLALALLLAPPPDVVLPRATLGATSPLAYELLSWAFEDGQPDWVESQLDHGTAVSLPSGTLAKLVGQDLRARPASATVLVLGGPATGRRLVVPRSAVRRDAP